MNRWSHDRTTLLALSVDRLLAALGMTESDRLVWYRSQVNARTAEAGNDYRKRKNLLRTVVGDPERLPDEFRAIFTERATVLNRMAPKLRKLDKSFEALCSSYVHLHLNRMSGPDSPNEQHMLRLLVRTREGLERAPVRSFAHAADF
jgi:lantibiotic biosynthesis protein